MTELIKVIVSIKDPFTLLAFFAVVLLIAFRTKKVPESLFRLLGQKLGRDRFYGLVNRALLFSFAVFFVLCGIAVLGQVLGYMTTARAATIEDLKEEVERSKADAAAAQRAIADYEKALALSDNNKLSEAIASLESSLKAVPTATARETLALLYQRAGNRNGATRLAEQAVAEARESGQAVKIVKAERLLASVKTPTQSKTSESCPSGAALVGTKLNLPSGGDSFETASPLAPCVYSGQFDVEGSAQYYKVTLTAGQVLRVIARTREEKGESITVKLHGPDGGLVNGHTLWGASNLGRALEYKADEPGNAYVSVQGGVRRAALEIRVM